MTTTELQSLTDHELSVLLLKREGYELRVDRTLFEDSYFISSKADRAHTALRATGSTESEAWASYNVLADPVWMMRLREELERVCFVLDSRGYCEMTSVNCGISTSGTSHFNAFARVIAIATLLQTEEG